MSKPPKQEGDLDYQAFLKEVEPLPATKKVDEPEIKESPPPRLPPPLRNPWGVGHRPPRAFRYLRSIEPPESPLTGDSEYRYCHPSVARKQWLLVQKDARAVEAHFDLHGHTLWDAAEAIEQFLDKARANDLRVVCIITGKGGTEARLKKALIHWLHQLSFVLGFATTVNVLGGTGAFVVLLAAQK